MGESGRGQENSQPKRKCGKVDGANEDPEWFEFGKDSAIAVSIADTAGRIRDTNQASGPLNNTIRLRRTASPTTRVRVRVQGESTHCGAAARRSGSGRTEEHMPVIKVKENESFEQAMRRFKKTCEKAGILTELRRREYYDKPSIRKKKKAAAARKRALKKMRRVAS